MSASTHANGTARVEAAASELAESAKNVGTSVMKLAEDTAHQARDMGSQAYQQLADTSKQQVAKLESTVKESPMSSILAAAGLGFILGALFRR